jgi:hypothetical protein
MTLPNRYNSSTGEYIGSISTVVDEVTVLGEWTQVMLPYPLKITSAVIINSGVSSNNIRILIESLIKEFVLAGSNDGYTWTNLYEASALTSTYLCYKCVYSGNTNYYYLRLVIKSSIPGTVTTDAVAINEIRYYETYADNTVINATLVNKTLKVAGGAGIQGNVNIGGRLTTCI